EGDLNGVIEKLDYLQYLGVDYIWLTPIYESPMNDNGSDISDYYKVNEQVGTIEDLERLIAEAHRSDVKIMMDIVSNHTSAEHDMNGLNKHIQIKVTRTETTISLSGQRIINHQLIGNRSLVVMLGNTMTKRMNITYIYSM